MVATKDCFPTQKGPQVNIMSGNDNNKVRHDKNKLVAGGFRKHMAANGGMTVDSKKKSPEEIDDDLTRRARAEDDVIAARATLRGAILKRKQIEGETKVVYEAVRQTAFVMFASSPEILADFGLAPRKAPRALTVDEKKVAAEKRVLTRKARHIMGTRQRKAIRAEASPLPASPAPTRTPAPAPVAGPPLPPPPPHAATPPTPIVPR
jgi:hypothetical protein